MNDWQNAGDVPRVYIWITAKGFPIRAIENQHDARILRHENIARAFVNLRIRLERKNSGANIFNPAKPANRKPDHGTLGIETSNQIHGSGARLEWRRIAYHGGPFEGNETILQNSSNATEVVLSEARCPARPRGIGGW